MRLLFPARHLRKAFGELALKTFVQTMLTIAKKVDVAKFLAPRLLERSRRQSAKAGSRR